MKFLGGNLLGWRKKISAISLMGVILLGIFQPFFSLPSFARARSSTPTSAQAQKIIEESKVLKKNFFPEGGTFRVEIQNYSFVVPGSTFGGGVKRPPMRFALKEKVITEQGTPFYYFVFDGVVPPEELPSAVSSPIAKKLAFRIESNGRGKIIHYGDSLDYLDDDSDFVEHAAGNVPTGLELGRAQVTNWQSGAGGRMTPQELANAGVGVSDNSKGKDKGKKYADQCRAVFGGGGKGTITGVGIGVIAGAGLGSVIPGVGTVAGAVAGGIIAGLVDELSELNPITKAFCGWVGLVGSALEDAVDWVTDLVVNQVVVGLGNYLQGTFISDRTNLAFQLWLPVRNFVDILAFIGLILIAFANLLRLNIDTYAIKRALPKIIGAIIVANLSFLILRVIIGVANILGNAAIEEIRRALFGINNANAQVAAAAFFFVLIPGFAIGSFFVGCGLLLFGLIATIIIAFLLLIQPPVVSLLVGAAPVAILAIALPFTENFYKQWQKYFFNWVFMLPAMGVIAFAVNLVGKGAGAVLDISHPVPQDPATGQMVITGLTSYIVRALLLYFAIMIPFRLGGTIMAGWAAVGKTLGMRAYQKGTWGAANVLKNERGNWEEAKTKGARGKAKYLASGKGLKFAASSLLTAPEQAYLGWKAGREGKEKARLGLLGYGSPFYVSLAGKGTDYFNNESEDEKVMWDTEEQLKAKSIDTTREMIRRNWKQFGKGRVFSDDNLNRAVSDFLVKMFQSSHASAATALVTGSWGDLSGFQGRVARAATRELARRAGLTSAQQLAGAFSMSLLGGVGGLGMVKQHFALARGLSEGAITGEELQNSIVRVTSEEIAGERNPEKRRKLEEERNAQKRLYYDILRRSRMIGAGHPASLLPGDAVDVGDDSNLGFVQYFGTSAAPSGGESIVATPRPSGQIVLSGPRFEGLEGEQLKQQSEAIIKALGEDEWSEGKTLSVGTIEKITGNSVTAFQGDLSTEHLDVLGDAQSALYSELSGELTKLGKSDAQIRALVAQAGEGETASLGQIDQQIAGLDRGFRERINKLGYDFLKLGVAKNRLAATMIPGVDTNVLPELTRILYRQSQQKRLNIDSHRTELSTVIEKMNAGEVTPRDRETAISVISRPKEGIRLDIDNASIYRQAQTQMAALDALRDSAMQKVVADTTKSNEEIHARISQRLGELYQERLAAQAKQKQAPPPEIPPVAPKT